MKSKLWILTPFLIILFLVACTTEEINNSNFVAGEIFTDSNIRVVKVDTMTVDISTMKFDSIVTSLASRLLIGQYTDPVFGKVTSSNYIGLLPSTFTIDSEAEYDSIALFLRYDNYYYNDTLQSNTINVKRLTGNFNADENDKFYNTSSVAYADEDLGIVTFKPRPLSGDSIYIKLSDNLGEEFFSNLQSKKITNYAEFTNAFKGLVLQPGEHDNGSVIGYSNDASDTYVRLYFSTAETDGRVQSYIDFTLNISDSPNPFFNQIIAKEPIDYLKELTDVETNLSSINSGNQSFIQSGVGIATRIQFPYIKTIKNLNGKGTLLDAVLKIRPVKNSYNDHLILRESLSVYVVDTNNDLTAQIYHTDGSTITADLNTDNIEFNDVYYEISLANYIEKLLESDRNIDEALLLFPSDYSSTVDRFILNGSPNSTYKTTLELTYAIYDENN